MIKYLCDLCGKEVKYQDGTNCYCIIKGEEATVDGRSFDVDVCRPCFKDITKDKLIKLLKDGE